MPTQTTTYDVTGTGCTAWEGSDGFQPPQNKADIADSELSSSEQTDISTDDNNSVSDSSAYQCHRFDYSISEAEGDVSKLTVSWRGTIANDAYMYLWNNSTSSWDTIDSGWATGSEVTRTVDQTANITDYIDGSGNVYVCVQDGWGLAGDTVTTEYTYLDVESEGPFEGSIAQTLSPLSQSVSGHSFSGALVQTLSSLTQSADGHSFSGAIDHQLHGLVQHADAHINPEGPIAQTLQGASQSAEGHVEVTGGPIVQTLTGLSQSVSGDVIYSGPAAQTLAGLSQSAQGNSPTEGSAAQTLAGLSQSVAGYEWWHPTLSLPEPGSAQRLLNWDLSGTGYLYLDGDFYAESDEDRIRVPASRVVRGYIQVTEAPVAASVLSTPLDEVALSWTGDALRYRVEQAPSGGSYSVVTNTNHKSVTLGPLADNTWSFRVTAIDTEGDESSPTSTSLEVSSAPEPPSGLDWSWDSGAGELTLTWNASSSGDVASYRVRSSAGAEELDLTSGPVQDSASLQYTQSFTTETGMYIFSVRAVDSDGNEEANISQAVAVPFVGGAPSGRPGEPRLVDAEPAAGGKIEVSFLYDPGDEYLGPGVAEEARIYWDNGTGTVDYSSPEATVSLGGPTDPARYSWTSGALTDGQEYLFVVRIATAVHPDGIETQNTAATSGQTATPNSDVPSAVVLTAEVV